MSEDRLPLVEVLLRQREAWKNHSPIRVEELLVRHPHLQNEEEAVLDLIYNETILREEQGQASSLEEYLARFPHLAPALRLQFEIEHALSLEAPPPTGLPPLADCEILGELGRGAMGVVYRGWQRTARRPVAVKVLAADVPIGRARNEVEAASRMLHPNIVQMFEVKEHQGRTALVLEYVEGGTLAEKLGGVPQRPLDAARFIESLAWATAYAHSRGVIHRDLKPANVLLSAGPTDALDRCIPKISDFGLAKLAEGGCGLTATTDLLGTPSYMAPEQAGGERKEVGPPCDVYALGAILYECLTGRPPFLGESVLDTLDQVRRQEPVPPSRLRPAIPHDLEVVTLKCLEKAPSRRYATARELAEDLHRFQVREPIRARSIGWMGHAWKWTQRQPLAALAILICCLVTVGGTVAGLGINRALRQQIDLAQDNAEALARQLERSRRLLYAGQLLRVGSVWETDPIQGLRLLEEESVCPPDLRCFSWRLLHAQCKRYRRAAALSASPSALACSPQGHHLAWGSAEGHIRILDGQTLATTREFALHPRTVTALAFSPDGTCLASGGAEGRVVLSEVGGPATSEVSATLEEPIASLAWHPDGKVLAVNSGTGTRSQVRLLDRRTARLRRTLSGRTHPRAPVAISPDGVLVASVGVSHTILSWDARTGRPRRPLRGHSEAVTGMAFLGRAGQLLTASHDGTVRLWDLEREVEQDRFTMGLGPLRALALHPAGQTFAVVGGIPAEAGDAVADVQLWDRVARRGSDPILAHPGGTLAVAFAGNGLALVTVGADRTLKVWDHPGRLEQLPLRGHAGTVGTVALSGHGRFLAWIGKGDRPLGGRGHEIIVQDLTTGTLVNILRGHGRPFQTLALSREGHHLASAAGHPGEPAELLVWEVRTGRLAQALSGHAGEVVGVSFAPEGKVLYSFGQEGLVKAWDLESGRLRHQVQLDLVPLVAGVVSQDGSTLATAGGAAGGEVGVMVLDARTGAHRSRRTTAEPVVSLAVSPEGTWLAYGGAGGGVRVGRVAGPRDWARLEMGMKRISSIAFSPEGDTLAVAGSGVGVKLWDVGTMQERASLPRHRRGACFVGFAEEGSLLVTASTTGMARLWHAPRMGQEGDATPSR